MDVQFIRAKPEDHNEVIDLANYVFSHSSAPIDFPSLLPKLYKAEYFMDGRHYLAKEDGKIKAVIGAYPLEFEFAAGQPVQGRGIGMVSVHPYCRSKGYMKALMKMALDDMKNDGIVFSCLGGLRQRYEYFGFTPTGCSYNFTCEEQNITHTLGKNWKSSFSLEKVKADDTTFLDQIMALHESKSFRMYRNRERLFDILSSWKAEIYAVTEAGRFEGYFIKNNNTISEIILKDYSRLIEVLGLVIRSAGYNISLNVKAGPHEREKITALYHFTEGYNQSRSYFFNILDFAKFTDALIKYKASFEKIKEGSFVLRIEDKIHGCSSGIRLFAGKDGTGVEETNDEPAVTMNSLEASTFLFSPLMAQTDQRIRENDFLRSLLPLPLFVEDADRI